MTKTITSNDESIVEYEGDVAIVSEHFNPPDPAEQLKADKVSKELESLEASKLSTKSICGFTKTQLEFMCDVAKLSTTGAKENVAKLKEDGFSSAEDFRKKGFLIKEIEDKSMQTKCVLLYKENSDEVYISFRGTKNKRNMITDMNFGLTSSGFMAGKVHAGFYNAFQGLWPQVREELDSLAKAQGKTASDLKYNFTGHSMGGAVAKIAAHYVHKEYHVQPHNISVVTFGDPRVFDTKQAREYEKALGSHTVRFTQENNRDIIPTLSPGFIGYKHVGAQIKVVSSSTKAIPHALKHYNEGLKKLGEDGLVDNKSVSFFYRPVKLIQMLREKIVYIVKPIKDMIKKSVGHENWHIKEAKNRKKHQEKQSSASTLSR